MTTKETEKKVVPKPKAKKCKYCFAKNKAGAKKCAYCGAKL